MEELLRFVAIRAPEQTDAPTNRRVVSLDTGSEFQNRLAQTEPENRFSAAQEYIASPGFLGDPQNSQLATSLLGASANLDLATVSASTLAGRIVDAIGSAPGGSSRRRSGAQAANLAPQNASLEQETQRLVASPEWQELRSQLADSLIALSLSPENPVRSTSRHELTLYLMNFIEQVAANGLSEAKPEEIPQSLLATQLALSPMAARPVNEGDDTSPAETPAAEKVKDLRKINRAAEFLLSMPRARLQAVTVEPPSVILEAMPPDDGLRTANDGDLRETAVSFEGGVFYTLKPAALEELEPDIRDIVARQLQQLDGGDVCLAAMALRQDEREIYAKALPMPGTHIRGTTLTLANTALAANISVREALDVVLNPGATFNPDILGSEIFGLLTLPRFGFLGMGDLMVVRQNLKAYAALDVAHIENVLQGESKEREHRRKRVTEESFFTESETEVEEERDTQTSERFELRSEVQEEVKETFKFDAGVKVTAQLGPFVELEADARFGYENAKTEGRKKASEYSRETTERASTRFAERVLERRERRLVEEIEEINRHRLDATSADEHIIGIYQWVNKIYEAQVYNYGLREMYEFFLPEPATFYIGSLVSKGLSDGNTPQPPPPFTVSPSTLNRSNYRYYTALYGASGVPAPPEEFVKVDLAQAGGPQDFDSSENGSVAAAFSVPLTDGYEYFGYRTSGRYTYREGDGVDFVISVSDQTGDPGTVPVFVKGHRIISWAVWVHITCRVTDGFMDEWRLKAWEAMRDGHAQMQREYEETLAANAVQEGVEITGRNPLANERIIREEIQRQCISALANESPAGGNGVSGASGNISVDWEKAYKKGLYTRFMHQAFEWENVSYIFYPFFWARKSRWLELFNIEDIDPDFQSFLQSGMARVVVPVRSGFEQHVEHFRRTGEIWSGGQPPTIGDPDFLSVAAEIKAQTGAPGDEEPVGEPWDIVVPTQLVTLRQDNQLPRWRQDANGRWVPVDGDAVASEQITGLLLIDADTQDVIRVLNDGDVINIADLPSTITVQAIIDPTSVGSLIFSLNGDQHVQIENGFPYLLYGNSGGSYGGVAPETGSYELEIVAFTEANGGGAAFAAKTVRFVLGE